MLFTNEQCNNIYLLAYDWLANHTPGGRCHISILKKYQNELWNPVIEVINKLSYKDKLNKKEKEFLKLVTYSGPIYRIQSYNSRRKGYIYESDFCQSWSLSLQGVSNVTNLCGTVLLIVGQAVNAIDVFGLLIFLLKNKYVTQVGSKHPNGLGRYEKEEEIVYPIQFKHITDIVAIDKDKITDWENHKKVIPKNKWKRNSIN